jgi:hypothetical protein
MAKDTDSGLDMVEFVAAFLLGLAAIAIAWSTLQSELWGGQQDEAYTESVRQANIAIGQARAADTLKALDQILFVEILTTGVCNESGQADETACEQILANLSDVGAAAVDEWLDGTVSTPFESPTYLDTVSAQGEEARLESQRFFQEAGEANENGDDYELASTILAAVLFFGGISVVFDDKRIAWVLLAGASLLFVGVAVYIASLPLAS